MLETTRPSSPSSVELRRTGEIPHGTRAVQSGSHARVIRGVYAPRDAWVGLAPWEKYTARVHAAAVRHPHAVFCLDSAAAMHGLPIFGDPGDVHVIRDGDARSRRSGGVRVHTTTDLRRAEEISGVVVSGLVDTVVDIARVRHCGVGLAVADAALRMCPSLTAGDLLAVNEARASSRGRKRARWALERASPLPESPLESIDRAVIEWLGFPEPELQVWIGRDRVDKWWPEWRIAGEGDGDIKYDGTFGDARAALGARHARDARLMRSGVTAVPHWGWREASAADPLEAILRSAGLPVHRPRDHAQLLSLSRAIAGGRP